MWLFVGGEVSVMGKKTQQIGARPCFALVGILSSTITNAAGFDLPLFFFFFFFFSKSYYLVVALLQRGAGTVVS
jgi:hypothetical protein